MSRHTRYELRRKCAKCNITATEDTNLSFHRFPLPGRHTLIKACVWAEYCYPTGEWSTEKPLRDLHSQHKMLCSKHFDDSSFTSSARIRLNNYAIPIGTQDLLIKFRQEQCATASGSQQDTNISVEKSQVLVPTETSSPVQVPTICDPTTDSLKADQVQNQAQESGELGGDKETTTAQPNNQLTISAEHNQTIEPSSAQPDIKLEEAKKAQEEVKDIKPVEHNVDTTTAIHEVIENNVQDKGDWQQREQELLKKIEQLEKVKNQRTEDGVKLELKVREEEIDLLKARVRNLETELQAALSKPSGKNHEMIENIKQQHEELLSKARGMIFDKTKMVKNQELQIEALTTQVQSLKDINVITKDLLEIRNSEVKAMEDRLLAMEARFKAEKDRYGLVLQRAQTSTTLNDDLKKEYETQLGIFKELREKYEQRVQALVSENTKLKEIAALKAGMSG